MEETVKITIMESDFELSLYVWGALDEWDFVEDECRWIPFGNSDDENYQQVPPILFPVLDEKYGKRITNVLRDKVALQIDDMKLLHVG